VRTRALSSSSPSVSPNRRTIYLLANNCRNEREMRCPVHGCDVDATAGVVLSHMFCAHPKRLFWRIFSSRQDVAAGGKCTFAAWSHEFSYTS
jgi:hypothetical protein